MDNKEKFETALTQLAEGDKLENGDDDIGCRLRSEVMNPFAKILYDHAQKAHGGDLEDWEKETEPFVQSFIMMIASMVSLYASVEFDGDEEQGIKAVRAMVNRIMDEATDLVVIGAEVRRHKQKAQH